MIASALVTGASGFVGGALVRRLATAGVRTVALLREGGGELRAPDDTSIERLRVPSFERVELERALEGRRFDVVLHLASYGVRPDQRDPREMVAHNVGLVAELLLATQRCLPRLFVHTGTWSEYGPLAPPMRLTESSPIGPLSQYAAAKASSVMVGAALAADLGVRFVTLRLFHIYGPGEAAHRLVPYLVGCLKRGETAELTGGEQVRDLVHVDDVAEAYLAAATGELSPGAYNVCSGTPVRVREIAERVGAAMGTSPERLGLGRRPYRSGEPMWAVGDPSRLRSATGWTPRIGLAEGIDAAVRHELSGAQPSAPRRTAEDA